MLRYSKISWRALIFFAVLILAVFTAAMIATNNAKVAATEKQAELQAQLVSATDERSLLIKELDSVGTDSYIEDEARNQYGYVKAGEIRFEIQNADLLDNYTKEEWQVISDEMAWDGK